MDISVKAEEVGTSWTLIDLLGRSMGHIVKSASTFSIEPDGHAIETMKSMKKSPFSSLDEALRAIEIHTRGICQIAVEVNDQTLEPR